MLRASWIPSPLVPPGSRPAVPILATARPSRVRSVQVVAQFLVLGLSLVVLLVTRGDGDRFARRVRELFERLGGLWIKAGQVIALRVDFLPASLCRELSRLQSQAMGFPEHVARAIVEEELGGPLERWFDVWEPQPIAAASIGQVYRARLREEQVWVAVKVQKPYSAELFAHDMAVIEGLVWLINRLHIYPHMKWADGLDEVRAIMREELDFSYEAGATRRMRKQLRAHGVYVPKVYLPYCTARVLVLEFLEMVLMADYLRVSRDDPDRVAQWREDNGFRPALVGRRLIHSFQRQMLEDNTYHGDMHPGNIGLLRNSRIALIDFGSTSFTEADYLQRFRLLMRTLATGEFAKGADMCFMLCASLPPIDLAAVHHKIVSVMQAWANRTWVRQLAFHDKSMGNLTMQIMQVLLGHRCTMEWAWLRLHRASSTLDASIIELAPGIDYRKITSAVFARAAHRRLQAIVSRLGARRATMAAVEALQQPARLQDYVALQASLIRRQVQVFRGFAGLAGSTLVSAVNVGRLILLLQVGVVLAAAAAASASGVVDAGARVTQWLGSLAAEAIAGDPRPLLVILGIDVWIWCALSRLRRSIGDGTVQLHRQGAL